MAGKKTTSQNRWSLIILVIDWLINKCGMQINLNPREARFQKTAPSAVLFL